MFKKLAATVLAAGIALTTVMTALPVNAAGAYFSELTGEPISDAIKSQRPIAVMVDNDPRALPHYGVADADIMYELVNSLANNRITRLMPVYKDWENESRIGNIRSTRPTNIMLASEYNAVLCHDGGPFYNTPYFTSTDIAHFSNQFYFSRVKNGKATEFTEYALKGDVAKGFRKSGVSRNYTVNPGNHFNFAAYGTQVNLNAMYPGALVANKVSLPFVKTGSQLVYNPATQTYDYWEYGSAAKDGGTNKQITFKNVFIQNCDIHQYDANGYLVYNCVAQNQVGYYLTNGYCVPVLWTKASETARTQYFDIAGNEILVNTGKTYITLAPSDTFGAIVIQ